MTFVGTREDLVRDGESPSALAAFRLIASSYFVGGLNRQMRRLLALEYAIHVICCQTEAIHQVGAIQSEPQSLRNIGRDTQRYFLAGCQHRSHFGMICSETGSRYDRSSCSRSVHEPRSLPP